MSFTFEFLGSGTSVGIPCIGCACAVCTSTDPRNKRLRCAALVRCGETAVVIDTGPDFREQMLRSKVKRVDAFVITHYHADHVVGIDDVRRFNVLQKQVIDCWADRPTTERIRKCFDYVFSDSLRMGLPNLRPREIELGKTFEVGPLRFEALPLDHHVMDNVALVITEAGRPAPRLAYCIDCKRMPDETVERLRGVETLVLDMLREQPHPTHMNLQEALAVIARIKPGRTFFSHISHEAEHAAIEAKLPPEIRVAYDGLVLAS
ncbi:MAG: MBL fold metallo-hydrolase [Planctomycetes bacterium]|nr:MBL fold metallo-hydrolase [Planctomycetota bacterium]